jgi:hypothetical protein
MRAFLIAGFVGVLVTAALWARAEPARDRITHASFMFNPVTFSSAMLGGALAATDMATIETVARAELAAAFHGLRITISDRRDARYHVRVVQELMLPMTTRRVYVAGSSHAVPGFGGSGAVSFSYYAAGALVYAPPQATRAELIEAIGRGLGRGAAHEFAHQFLSGKDLHQTRDRGSYEYYAASRAEQYYGPMHWDTAKPLLAARFGGTSRYSTALDVGAFRRSTSNKTDRDPPVA